MTTTAHDPLIARLNDLAAPAPGTLLDAVVDRWVRAPGPFDDVFTAFTTHGVRFVRTAGYVDGDPARFRDAYRTRFGRPVLEGDRPPAGLAGALRGSEEIPELDLAGLTDFESAVLSAVRRIPVGETRPYAWVARAAGRPAAVRAAGSVLARNPVPLLIPCHRVTRSDGALGSYMFGTARKEQLLRAEHAALDRSAERAARGHHFLGDVDAGTYCYPTCHHAPAEPSTRGFRDAAAARAAGFAPCPHCS